MTNDSPGPQGPHASQKPAEDRTCRLWSVETGECLQVLEGHSDEIFSCAFNYEGDTVITGSKDPTGGAWRCYEMFNPPRPGP
eukprot:s3296_g3.t1